MITHYQRFLKLKASHLRKNLTASEVLLWSRLRRRKLGYLFLRQKPLLMYIVDFYCPKLKLVVEIDGSSHFLKREHDLARDWRLKQHNIAVLRIKHIDVLTNIEGVLHEIKSKLNLSAK